MLEKNRFEGFRFIMIDDGRKVNALGEMRGEVGKTFEENRRRRIPVVRKRLMW